MSALLLVCRLTLICVLAVAGIAKLRDRSEFAESLRGFPYLPAAAVPTLAVAVPVAELSAAVLLALPWTLTAGLVLAAVLCAAFTAVAISAMRGSSSVGCACFGSKATVPMGPWHLARNVTLMVLAVVGAVIAVAEGTGASLDAAPLAIAVGTAAYLTALAVFTDDLAFYFSARAARR